jgi:hypothetical protein
MLKFLFFTAVPVGELVKIKVDDLHLGGCKFGVDPTSPIRDLKQEFLVVLAS